MIINDSTSGTPQDTVNEAVDAAKSDLHRITVMWIFTGVAVGFFIIGRWIAGTIVIGSLLLRLQTVGLNAALGVALATVMGAYITFVMALGVFIVNTFSLVVWRARYGRLETSDTDYSNAKRQWSMSLALWCVMAVVIVFPVTLLVVLAYTR